MTKVEGLENAEFVVKILFPGQNTMNESFYILVFAVFILVQMISVIIVNCSKIVNYRMFVVYEPQQY